MMLMGISGSLADRSIASLSRTPHLAKSKDPTMESQVKTTFFAPSERATEVVLDRQTSALQTEPIVEQLLDSLPEPTMLLNAHRQIVLANEKTEAVLGRAKRAILGMRVGEAIDCAHAFDEPAGCGTTRFCRNCGAAQAMMTCITDRVSDVQECRIETRLSGDSVALDLRVAASPLSTAGEAFTVFSVRDITDEKRRALLERVFFHDILNSAGGLHGLLQVLDIVEGDEKKDTEHTLRDLSEQIIEEIQSQRDLLAAEQGQLAAKIMDVNVPNLLDRLCMLYRRHSVGHQRDLVMLPPKGQPVIFTDGVLLGRVLGNLIKNALEASSRGQTVTVAFDNSRYPLFMVQNSAVMPEDVQLQMFQRSFSTKEGKGRGIGSYSVKLLTEKYLRGKVWFSSSPDVGTTFFVSLPSPSDQIPANAFDYGERRR
jgi:signal transduction histidine kinase